MTKEEFAHFLEHQIIPELRETRKAGQSEYAGGEDAFGNFNRLANELGIDRKQVLWIYGMKHKDGIAAYIRGHRSQREPVQGRIKDLMLYLALLWGMVTEEQEDAIRTLRP